MSPTFTVLTPTFNRAHTLHRVWESLRAQTFEDFEWLVVDDGSTDRTAEQVQEWSLRSPFPVRYLKQDNRGKHVAMNRGAQAARGELVVTLDSDDACVPTALERFAFHWRSIPEERRTAYYGVVCHCADVDGRRVGDPFPAAVVDARGLDCRYLWHVRGEKWGPVRADLLRATPFPETPERVRIPESVVWDRLGQTHLARFVDEALRIYHWEPGAGSLGSPGDPARYAWGSVLQHRIVLDEHLEYFRSAPLTFLISAIHYVRFSLHAGIGSSKQRRALTSRGARALWLLGLPAGWAAFTIDRIRRGRAMQRLMRLLRAWRGSKYPARFAISRLLFHSGISAMFKMTRGGIVYRFWPSSMSMTLWADPGYAEAEAEIVRTVVRPGDTVVDVGANIGTVALEAAAATGPGGSVIAYEPHPRTFRYLVGNAALNPWGHLDLRGAAIGERVGIARITDAVADDQNLLTNHGAGVEVAVVTLDQDLPPGPIRLLKIDVEGFELPALQGGRSALQRTSWIYIEVADAHQTRFGHSAGELLTLLAECGFELWTREDGNSFSRLSPASAINGCINVLGFRRRSGVVPPPDARLTLDELVRAGG